LSTITMPGLPRGYRYPQSTRLDSFAGGINSRDAASELAANEVIDAWNITFDERGGAASRLGYVKYNGTPYGVDLIQNEHWSRLLSTKIVNVGAKLYLGTSNTVRKTFTTGERVTFAELGVYVVACHPTDGLFTSTDGVTWTVVADADAPHGTCVAAWQNKLWVGKPNGSVQWSAIGDPTAWSPTDFNNLWTKDASPVVALHIASGQDIVGRPLLYAFKQESWYVITDPATGAYTVVDATVGAASAISVVGAGPFVYALSRRGIFRAAGAQVGATDMSDRMKPLWDQAQLNLGQLDKWCAGRSRNRARFSLTRAGSTANDLALTLHTEQGWLSAGSHAMSCYSMSSGASDVTYGGSPTVAGQSYQLESGGTDDGAPITGKLQTRWVDLLGGFNASILHAHIRGRGDGFVQVLKNYIVSGDTYPIYMQAAAATRYDTGLHYDSGNSYYVPSEEPTATLGALGAARQMSLLFTFTASTTVAAPQVLNAGAAPQVGAFAVYSVELMEMRLGIN
jgi:hypothetical protein